MASTVVGRIDWGRRTYDTSHRDYFVKFLVKNDSPDDGPQSVYLASGAPAIGTGWAYGNDNDPYALCIPEATCSPLITREKNIWWTLEQAFTTRPISRCQTSQITNPLAEPADVSGSFVRFVRTANFDRHGDPIISSSFELIEGLEIDDSRPSVVIEQNVADLELDVITAMRDTVNDAPLWGLTDRTIKLSNISWHRKVYGTCTYFYTRRFEFDIKFEGWDFSGLVDTGFRVFDDETHADTPANRADPRKYRLATDTRGGNPPQKVLLNGSGDQVTDVSEVFILPTKEVYVESNFLLLGIPTSF